MSHDWQSPAVLARLVEDVAIELKPWLEGRDRNNHTQNLADIAGALLFGGERLDGFQMARYLEDSRYWPSDEALVGHLKFARELRKAVIARLNRELAASPLENQEGEVVVGTLFYCLKGNVWEVTEIRDPYYVPCRMIRRLTSDSPYKVGDTATATIPSIKKTLQEKGRPIP